MSVHMLLERHMIQIRDDLLRLSSMVDQAIACATQALVERNASLAQQVSANDAVLNQLRFAIEESCYSVLAMHHPNATDLRVVVGTVNVATNLERIGDHAAGVARLALRIIEQPLPDVLVALPQMAEIGRWMVRNAVEAFQRHNVTLAEEIVRRDQAIDQIHRRFHADMIATMRANPALIERATLMLWISHNLERIGDRATNICERAIYAATGELKEF